MCHLTPTNCLSPNCGPSGHLYHPCRDMLDFYFSPILQSQLALEAVEAANSPSTTAKPGPKSKFHAHKRSEHKRKRGDGDESDASSPSKGRRFSAIESVVADQTLYEDGPAAPKMPICRLSAGNAPDALSAEVTMVIPPPPGPVAPQRSFEYPLTPALTDLSSQVPAVPKRPPRQAAWCDHFVTEDPPYPRNCKAHQIETDFASKKAELIKEERFKLSLTSRNHKAKSSITYDLDGEIIVDEAKIKKLMRVDIWDLAFKREQLAKELAKGESAFAEEQIKMIEYEPRCYKCGAEVEKRVRWEFADEIEKAVLKQLAKGGKHARAVHRIEIPIILVRRTRPVLCEGVGSTCGSSAKNKVSKEPAKAKMAGPRKQKGPGVDIVDDDFHEDEEAMNPRSPRQGENGSWSA